MRAGRPPSVGRGALLDAATRIADGQGLEAVTLRAVGDELGVSAMAVHRVSGGIDELRHALVSETVEDAVARIDWPEGDWRAAVEVFARGLRDLLLRHPLVLEAHRRAPLETPGAADVAHRIVAELRSAGLGAEEAAYGYAAVHDFVTGHVAIRLGREEPLVPASAASAEGSVFTEFHDASRRFEMGLGMLLDGITVTAGRSAHGRR
ncbi:TetR/AcrR family transcriptional regulator C-terminal domain-containing protein [Microbacterium sp.]|uniref:TetR/AcrR family transcriptional regulator n=1 Tax=Microbacterium sp. TaxID=51671 RepID=UPI0033410C99